MGVAIILKLKSKISSKTAQPSPLDSTELSFVYAWLKQTFSNLHLCRLHPEQNLEKKAYLTFDQLFSTEKTQEEEKNLTAFRIYTTQVVPILKQLFSPPLPSTSTFPNTEGNLDYVRAIELEVTNRNSFLNFKHPVSVFDSMVT